MLQGKVCVKSFHARTLGERLKDCLRWRGRAMQAWVALRGFSVRELPAARPIAVLERRNKLASDRDYLVMEALEDTRDLEQFVRTGPSPEERRKLALAVAGLLHQLFRAEVYHPDMKPTNVLVRWEGGEPRLWLLDMARVKFESPGDKDRWVRYLTQLNAGLPSQVTLHDRLRCLRACSRGRWSRAERKRMAREIYEGSLERDPKW
jgi:hypothetical protein